jgi:hypothetical protein
MTIEGTLMAWSMLGFSLGSPGVSIGLGRMIAHRQAAPTRTASLKMTFMIDYREIVCQVEWI